MKIKITIWKCPHCGKEVPRWPEPFFFTWFRKRCTHCQTKLDEWTTAIFKLTRDQIVHHYASKKITYEVFVRNENDEDAKVILKPKINYYLYSAIIICIPILIIMCSEPTNSTIIIMCSLLPILGICIYKGTRM